MNASVGPTVSIWNWFVEALPGLVAASTTVTVIVCRPSATFMNVCGDVHATGAPPSSEHVGDMPVCVNTTVGSLLFESAGGWPVMVTVGGVVSTTNIGVVNVALFVAASVTRTLIVCVPSATVGVNPVVHALKPPPSTAHAIPVAPPAVVNCTVGVVSFESARGSVVNVTLGGIVSIVKLGVVALPGLLAASNARTS